MPNSAGGVTPEELYGLYSESAHSHSTATSAADGFMSAAEDFKTMPITLIG